MKSRLALNNIQFLRFAASLATLFFHSRWLLPKFAGGARAIMSVGFAGVDIFFVISGFIMWYTTYDAAITASIFGRRRIARIFTGYWPYLLIALILFGIFDPAGIGGKDIFGSTFLLPITLTARVIQVSWTLTHELYFYLLFFLLLCLPAKFRQRALYIAGGALLAGNCLGVLRFDFYTPAFYQETSPGFRVLISPYTFEFLAGIMVCQAYLAGIRRFAKSAAVVGILIFGIGGWYSYCRLNEQLGNAPWVNLRVLIFGSASCFVVYAAACIEQRGRGILSWICELFGGASYSLYLSHTLLLDLCLWLAPNLGADSGWAWLIVVCLILTYSTLHYLTIERPLHRFALQWLKADSRALRRSGSPS